jgi:hypothetical protein
LDESNAGAVFQASSLFNCLETSPPGVQPDDGITRYCSDASQGSACAISCPAATVFRNYFVNGAGQGGTNDDSQVDCLAGVSELLRNSERSYWRMDSGHCMPASAGSIARLSQHMRRDLSVARRDQIPMVESVRSQLQVGVHWDTEVWGGGHRVCQVFCSALPVGMVKSVKAHEWATFACALLLGAFEATLLCAAILAARRGSRVKVYLTLVGGGALGNRRSWIEESLESALVKFANEPLDVGMVFHKMLPDSRFVRLERGREAGIIEQPSRHKTKAEQEITRFREQFARMRTDVAKKGSADPEIFSKAFLKFDANMDGRVDREELSSLDEWHNINSAAVIKAFANFDVNGDGTVDVQEFMVVMQTIDSSFFTEGMLKIFFEEADANDDQEVHYAEFLAWLFSENPIIVHRVLASASLYDC